MKKLILAAFALTTAASVFAQGTVIFNNRVVGTVVQHVYAPLATAPGFSQIGNGSNDTASSNTVWTGFSLIGNLGTAGLYQGATTMAQLLSAPGAGATEASLVPQSPIGTFRTGAGAGWVQGAMTATLGNVGPDAAVATLEMVAWDNSTGLYPTWTQAFPAWTRGLIAAGESGRFNLNAIGGSANIAPSMGGLQSFNLYSLTIIPEPSTFALAGLGLAALVAFRRRSK
jgi:hypothetical protein